MDREAYEGLKSSRELFDWFMAKHIFEGMLTIFSQHGTVNLDCLHEISKMNLDEAKQFLNELSHIGINDSLVIKCFFECKNTTITEQILIQVQKIARQYIHDNVYGQVFGCDFNRRGPY